MALARKNYRNITSFSVIGLSRLWTLGVPVIMMRMGRSKNKEVSAWLISLYKNILVFKIEFTFEAFIKAASSLVKLVIVRSAIEYPLKRTIVAELRYKIAEFSNACIHYEYSVCIWRFYICHNCMSIYIKSSSRHQKTKSILRSQAF